MARNKTVANNSNIATEKADLELTKTLGGLFDTFIENQFGSLKAPEPLITPFGIAHLDALLGGGFVSSGPISLSSTPETGKSTVAYQFCKVFQDTYDNAIIMYLDIEGSGNATSKSEFRISRAEAFELDGTRFKHQPIVANVMQLFEMIEALVTFKTEVEKKKGKELYLMVVWDSIASTPSDKTLEVSDPNKIIG